MNKTLLKHIFITVSLFFVIILYGTSVDDFLKNNRIDISGDTLLFLNDSFNITADNGEEFIIKKLNPDYDEFIRVPYYEMGISGDIVTFVENEVYYFLLDSNNKNILFKFDAEKNYLNKYDDELKINKTAELESVILYSFTMINENNNADTVHFWVDKNKEIFTYNGSFYFPHITFNYGDYNYTETTEDREYYEYIKEVYIFIVEEEIKRCKDWLENDIDYVINDEAYEAALTIRVFNEELGEQLLDQLEELYANENKSLYDKGANIRWISSYVQTVSEFKRFYKDIDALAEYADTFPEFQGELPVNGEELQEYLTWQIVPYQEGAVMDDYFDTQVKFEIVPEGLKVLSAGRDKVWDTEDDQHLIRTYESVGMKPLN